MNATPSRPVRKIGMLAALQGLTVFVPFSAMKFMPESNWFWHALMTLLLLLAAVQIFLSYRWFNGRQCVAAVAGSIGFTVIGLPLISFAGVLFSLMIGTFVFPPR